MFERFTDSARQIVFVAAEQARELKHGYIGTEHLLVALARDPTAAGAALRDSGVDADRVQSEIVRRIGIGKGTLAIADADALKSIGIDLDAVRRKVEESFGPGALDHPSCAEPKGFMDRLLGRGGLARPSGHLPFTARSKKVLELSLREAVRLGHDRIDSAHILLGVLREGEGLAAQILVEAGVDLGELRRRTLAGLDQAA
jgi:ATP-dependent Clp protease ATP-binding subunit ClpA